MTYDEAYAALCDGCWREKECHEDMCYCDTYLEATEEATTVRKSRTVQKEANDGN